MTKSRFFQWLGIGISLAVVVLLFTSLRVDRVISALMAADYWWLVPAVFISLASFIFRGQRFRLFLWSLSHFSLLRAYSYMAVNYMGNNVLPARAGEVLLSYVVLKQENIPVSSSLAVTILGRVTDGLLLLLALLASLFFLPFPLWVDQILVLGLLLFGAALGALLWLVFGPAHHHRGVKNATTRVLPGIFESFLELVVRQLKGFQSGLAALKNPDIVVRGVLLSIAIWLCEGLVYLTVGMALHVDQTFWQWLFLLALANLAASIPSGPASIGTFEGIIIVAMGLWGIPPHQAAAYAVLLHATQVIPITLVGAGAYTRFAIARPDGRNAPSSVLQ